MKWDLSPRPKNGDVRVLKKFAIVPMRVDNTMVWLEPVVIQQEFRTFSYETIDGVYSADKWFTTKVSTYEKSRK